MKRNLDITYIKGADGFAPVKLPALKRHIRTETGLKTDDIEDVIKIVIKDRDSSVFDDVEDQDLKRALKKAHRLTVKLFADSDECVKQMAAEAAKAEDDARAKRDTIIIASSEGQQLSTAYVRSSIDGIQQIVGKGFTVTSTGLEPRKGAKFSEAEVARAISTLTESSDGLARVGAAIGWSIGDLCLFAKSNFENGEDLIAQAVAITGRAKHTVIQAMRLAEHFPRDKRADGLSFTHHQEFFNYSGLLTPAQMASVVKEVLKGEVESAITTSDGREIAHSKPLSCAKTRELLREKAGKTKAGKETVEEKKNETDEIASKSLNFIYVNTNGDVMRHAELSLVAAKSGDWIVIDIEGNRLVGKDGSPGADIKPLPEAMFREKKGAKTPD